MSNPLNAFQTAPTPALKEAIAEEAAEDAQAAEAEQKFLKGEKSIPKSFKGEIKYLATVELSKEITGNGIGGHDRIIWDRRYRDQIGDARDKFNELVRRGFTPYLVRKDGSKANRPLDEFDPDAEEIIMVAPTAAG